MTPKELEELRTFIDKNLAQDFIQPARLKVAALVLFREKKDGSLRLCVDYMGLNAVCVENVYPSWPTCQRGKFSLSWTSRRPIIGLELKREMSEKQLLTAPSDASSLTYSPLGYKPPPPRCVHAANK